MHCHRRDLLRLGAAGLTIAVVSPAFAIDTKPQVTIKTRAAEISVTVDDDLKAHPGLRDNLLAEGRRWADQQRAEAEKAYRENPGNFAGDRRWTAEREYTPRSLVSRYVSVVRTDSSYEGGAHPNTYIDTILWDRDARKRISIRPFLKESADNGPTMKALAKLVRTAVAREKIDRGAVEDGDDKLTPEELAEKDHFIVEGVLPTLLKLGPVTLAPSTVAGKSSGFTFHFQPYAVGPYAEGSYLAFVEWRALAPFLPPEGVSLFAGERPPGDDDQNR